MSKKYECWYCGIETEIEIQNLRAFCPECFEEHKQKHLEIVKKYANLKTKIMFETALRILEKSGIAVNKYQDSAFAVIESALSDTEKFLSSYEIIAAIILEHNGYDYKDFFVGVSYDINFSKLVPASNGRGGLEIAVRYIIRTFKPKKIIHRVCPDYI
jgi:hypothetical protein